MSLRVLLFATNLALGGAERQVAWLAGALQRRGLDVSVLSLLRPTAFEAELRARGVPVHTLDAQPGRLRPVHLLRFLALMRRLRPQILHAHMFHANLAARLARAVCPFPVLVSTVHSLAESSREGSALALRDRLYRLTDPLSDATVFVGRAVAARHRQARAVSPARTRIIPNAVPTAGFNAPRSQAGEFTWLAAGRLMWKKDFATLLRAFSLLGEGRLLLAGAGPQERELRALAGPNVTFLGVRDDIPALMASADAFVLSSVVEGLPVVLLEAAAAGLPAVATNVGDVSDAVLDGETGFLAPPGDPHRLAEAMRRLLRLTPPQRERMSAAARSRAAACFDLDAVAAQWEHLYRELFARHEA